MKLINQIKKIENQQLFLLNKVKLYNQSLKKRKIDHQLSNFSFFSSYGETVGKLYLDYWLKKISFFKIIFFYIKNILAISSIHNYYFTNFKKKNFKNLIVTWGSKKDFDEENFTDSFLDYKSSKLRNFLIVVIYLDDVLPAKIPFNVTIYKKKNNSRSYYFLIQVLFTTFVNFFSINRNLFHSISYNNIYSEKFLKNFINFVKVKKINRLIMPYEGQFFQNYIFHKIKFFFSSYNIGVSHSMLPAFPINFLFKKVGSPDKLYVSSNSQKKVLTNFFGWKPDKIKVSFSLRIKKDKKKNNQKNKIFLPINLSASKFVFNKFKNYYMKLDKKVFFEINNHPRASKSYKHLKLIKKINNLINHKAFSKEGKFDNLIFIGCTSAFVEYLQLDRSVFHISDKPAIECYTNKMWKNINLYEIENGIYRYNLSSDLIKLGNKNFSLLNLIKIS
jgi:hypothetical protein